MERLNYSHLFYFYITAKEGSIKGAAEKVFVTQPTISDQIKLLEDHLGCKLFERKNRGLILTNEGKVALEYAEKIFSLGKELTTRLQKKLRLPKKSIDIGITQSMSQYFLYEKIMPLFDQSDYSIHFLEKERHYLLADLEEGNIDLLFTDNKEGISSNINAYRVGINQTFAVAHKSFKHQAFKFPQDLNSIPFFNYTSESGLKFEIDLFFRRHQIYPRVLGEGDDIDLMMLITESAKAFTIVPEAALKKFLARSQIAVLGEIEQLQTEVWGLIRTDSTGPALDILTGPIKICLLPKGTETSAAQSTV